LDESARNKKYYSFGQGKVIESKSKKHDVGGHVSFFACNHPKCVDVITLHEDFVIPEPNILNSLNLWYYELKDITLPHALQEQVGWNYYSGWQADNKAMRKGIINLKKEINQFGLKGGVTPPVKTDDKGKDRSEAEADKKGISSVLFGYGNYAKTIMIPSFNKNIAINCIHEVDPLQIGKISKWDVTLDTSPYPRTSENYDAWFIAGYHHTHTPIALHALKKGAYAVAEKPLATTKEQLNAIESSLKDNESQLFTCFHKRYSKFNDYIYEDLELAKGQPVNYHCIVYEIPLPEKHWYNWPNSGSRILSNGCHWIDHFMFLNDYAAAAQKEVVKDSEHLIRVYLQLENGAHFTMVLTDIGSKRLGVRDHVEIRSGNTTITITDDSNYHSENNAEVIRKEKINKISTYRNMYKKISSQIVKGEKGDSLKSLKSSKITIALDSEIT
jgi:predicted dehydrogenase